MRITGLILCVASMAVFMAPPATADPTPAGATIVLGGGGLWRKHYTFLPPMISVEAARAAGKPTDPGSRAKPLERWITTGLATDPPPANWTAVDFDDSHWLGGAGAEFTTGDSRMHAGVPLVYARGTDRFVPEIGLVCARGRFAVADPADVRSLSLALTYRGGFVAYLNGREIARASLPAGKLAFDTPAEPHGLDAFAIRGEDGEPAAMNWYYHRDAKFVQDWAKRERHFGPAAIDTHLLRKGTNVLAVEFHRSDYPAECATKKVGIGFATLGMAELFLRAGAKAGAIVGTTDGPAGLQVWAVPSWQGVYENSFADPAAPAPVIRIAAVRNGVFGGQVVVGSTGAIRGLKVTAGELRSADGGTIPAADCRVLYASLNPVEGQRFGWRLNGLGVRRFDRLMSEPPAEVTPATFGKPAADVRKSMGLPPVPAPAAVAPIYLSFNVPKGIPAGLYRGRVTVSADGAAPMQVPVELTVADWTLPAVKDYVSLVNIYESPETLARYYKVQMWSEQHWRMIERSFELMGQIGNIGLFFPLLAETQLGNDESRVTWIRQPGGGYKFDFTAFDRYLATALKHHDRLRFVAISVWGRECSSRRGAEPHGAHVTVLDPATGERTKMKLPAFGTPECEKLLAPLLTAVRARLKAAGLEKLMMLGLPDDVGPSPEQVAMFRRLVPGIPWIRESHFNRNGFSYGAKDRNAVVPVAYNSIVWGGAVPDPARRRLYGWRYNPDHLIMTFNRPGASALTLINFPPPYAFRMWMCSTLAGGRNGNGRVGGDYWKMGVQFIGAGRPSSEAGGGSRGTLFGRYLYSTAGQLGIGNSTTDLFAPGPDGPVTTVRFENAREGNEEAEARIFIERAMLDTEHPLPEELAAACRTLLDEHTNALRIWPAAGNIASQDCLDRTRRLYAAAAKVADALAK